MLKVNKRQITWKMKEGSQNDNRRVAKSTFKDILISPNNDDVIIPTSATYDKAVLHIGIGNGCGMFIEKFGVENDKELKTSVEYATRKFTDARNQRKNKGKDLKASKSEDIEKIVDESGEKFMSDIPSMEDIDRQLAKLVDHHLVKSPTEIKNATDTISDTKPLKENKSLNIESDIGTTDKSIQSTIGTVFTSDIRSDERRKRAEIAKPGFDDQTIDHMNIHLYKLNETRFKAEKTTSFETIDKAYQEELLQIAIDKEADIYKPTNIWPSTEKGSGFPIEEDMHVYLDELFVISKRGSQMFDEYVSVTAEKRRKGEQEDVPESGPTSATVNIAKDFTVADSNVFEDVLFKDQRDPILTDTIVDRAAENDSDTLYVDPDTLGDFLHIESGDSMSVDIDAVDEIADSHTLDDVFVIETNDETVDITESDDDIVNIEAIALQNDQDEVDITTARNDIDETYNDIVNNDDNLFGIMSLYIKSDLHFDLQNIPASAEHSGQKKDFGYKFFSFSTFFK